MKTKLTLSTEQRDIARARRLAKQQHSSISALFERFIRSTAVGEGGEGGQNATNGHRPLGRLMRMATGQFSNGRRKSTRQLFESALLEKHGL